MDERTQAQLRAPLAVAVAAAAMSMAVACHGSVRTVPLLGTAGAPWTNTPKQDIPLEVVTRSTSVPDPLPVRGAQVVYADVEEALGMAVGSATVPWAQSHRAQRPEGWQITVEVVGAEASYQDSRLRIFMDVRATLRTRTGNSYLAQSYAHCEQAGLVEPAEGASVLYSCMARIGRDLANWLGGLEP